MIPAMQEVEMGDFWFKANSGKKVSPISKNKSGIVVHICNSSYVGGRGRKTLFEGMWMVGSLKSYLKNKPK
jgi:protein subunit release factor B